MFIITTVYNLKWILIDAEFSIVCRISSTPHLIDQVWSKIKAFLIIAELQHLSWN